MRNPAVAVFLTFLAFTLALDGASSGAADRELAIPGATGTRSGSLVSPLTADADAPARRLVEGPYRRVTIVGDDPRNGIFDPSVEYGPDGIGWLAYSAVFGGDFPFGPRVETHLAKSLDHGKTWHYAGILNQSVDGGFRRSDGHRVKGSWNHEVPSLVFDPDDSGREWKIFSHRVLFSREHRPGRSKNEIASSSITYRHAPHPTGPWSQEIGLFRGKALPARYAKDVRINLNTLHPDLSEYMVFSEPGSLEVDGVLYVSLTALKPSGSDRIVLLASDDHCESWRYVGTLANRRDARTLGFRSFDGSSLVEVEGRQYLIASPMKRSGHRHSYYGTLVFEIEDISSAHLKRDDRGGLVAELYIAPDESIWNANGGGQGDYDEQNTRGGIMISQAAVRDAPEIFQIFSTRRNVP